MSGFPSTISRIALNIFRTVLPWCAENRTFLPSMTAAKTAYHRAPYDLPFCLGFEMQMVSVAKSPFSSRARNNSSSCSWHGKNVAP